MRQLAGCVRTTDGCRRLRVNHRDSPERRAFFWTKKMQKLSRNTKMKGFAILLRTFAIYLDDVGTSYAFRLSGAREVADMCSTFGFANDEVLRVIDDLRYKGLETKELYKRIEEGLEVGNTYTEEELLERLKKLL